MKSIPWATYNNMLSRRRPNNGVWFLKMTRDINGLFSRHNKQWFWWWRPFYHPYNTQITIQWTRSLISMSCLEHIEMSIQWTRTLSIIQKRTSYIQAILALCIHENCTFICILNTANLKVVNYIYSWIVVIIIMHSYSRNYFCLCT